MTNNPLISKPLFSFCVFAIWGADLQTNSGRMCKSLSGWCFSWQRLDMTWLNGSVTPPPWQSKAARTPVKFIFATTWQSKGWKHTSPFAQQKLSSVTGSSTALKWFNWTKILQQSFWHPTQSSASSEHRPFHCFWLQWTFSLMRFVEMDYCLMIGWVPQTRFYKYALCSAIQILEPTCTNIIPKENSISSCLFEPIIGPNKIESSLTQNSLWKRPARQLEPGLVPVSSTLICQNPFSVYTFLETVGGLITEEFNSRTVVSGGFCFLSTSQTKGRFREPFRATPMSWSSRYRKIRKPSSLVIRVYLAVGHLWAPPKEKTCWGS